MSNARNVQMGNRILYNKSIEKTKQVHQQRLREISLTAGRVLSTQQNIQHNQPELNKKKKAYQQENKNTEIERENRILLEKITNIMATKASKTLQKTIAAPKSMNLSKRKDLQTQIAKENQIILKRLMEKKPHYDLQLYEQQWQNIKALEQNFYDNHNSMPFSPASAFSIGGGAIVPEKNCYNNRRQHSAVHSKGNSNSSNINYYNDNSSMTPAANLERYKLPSVPQTAPEGKLRSMSCSRNQQNSNGMYSCKNSTNSLNQSFRGKTPLVRRMSEDRQRLVLQQRQQEQGLSQQQQQLLHRDCRVINGYKLDIEVLCTSQLIIIRAEEIEGTQIHMIEIPRQQGYEESGEAVSIEGEYIKSLIDRLDVVSGQLSLQQPRNETTNDNRNTHKYNRNNGNMLKEDITFEGTTTKVEGYDAQNEQNCGILGNQ